MWCLFCSSPIRSCLHPCICALLATPIPCPTAANSHCRHQLVQLHVKAQPVLRSQEQAAKLTPVNKDAVVFKSMK